jgi:Methyltransferase domain
MLRYALATAALGVLSRTRGGAHLYHIGRKTVGARLRQTRGLHPMYVDSARLFLQLFRRLALVHDGDHLLELGTGPMHWYATVVRMFYDVSITLFDVADNRQLGTYQTAVRQLRPFLDDGFCATPDALRRAEHCIDVITNGRTFEEIYGELGFSYVVEKTGSLEKFGSESFDLVFSDNTLEHLQREVLPSFVGALHRICKKGGHSAHGIDLGDHVGYYDPYVSPKVYLRFSTATWQTFLENQLQYINRVQRPEWLALFRDAGFELTYEKLISAEIDERHVAREFRVLSSTDLACHGTIVVHRRPYS